MLIDHVFASKVKYLIFHQMLTQYPLVAAQAIYHGWIMATIDHELTESYEVTETGKIVFGMTTPESDDNITEAGKRAATVHAKVRGLMFNAGILIERYEQTKNGARIRVDTADVHRLNELPIEYYVSSSSLISTNIKTMHASLQTELDAAKNQLTWISIDLAAEKNTNQRGERLFMDCKRERDNLKTELEAAKKRIAELGKQMEDAGYWLGLADSSDENASRAYDILKGLNQS